MEEKDGRRRPTSIKKSSCNKDSQSHHWQHDCGYGRIAVERRNCIRRVQVKRKRTYNRSVMAQRGAGDQEEMGKEQLASLIRGCWRNGAAVYKPTKIAPYH